MGLTVSVSCCNLQMKQKELNATIEDLKAQVAALQLENASLSSKNTVLEKVLSMRDESLKSGAALAQLVEDDDRCARGF